jgi:hypothetical protein
MSMLPLLILSFLCIAALPVPILCLATRTSNQLQPCPATRWSNAPTDISPLVSEAPLPKRSVPFLKSIQRPANNTTTDEYDWLQQNALELMESMNRHGALKFEGFQLPRRTKKGLRRFCGGLGRYLEACEDSLASIRVRSLLSASDGVYRAVETFIGLHNDCTFSLAPPYAAFCCFRQADAGGAFLLADGREILRALDPDVVRKLCERGVRVRVARIPTPFLAQTETKLEDDSGSLFRDIGSNILKTIVGLGLDTFLPKLELEVAFSDDQSLLQILEPLKSPLNAHPQTGEWTFFSGVHSQSAYLQQKRAADAFAGVAVTDVFYGEIESISKPMESIETEVLDHIEDVLNRHTVEVLMKPGDVVLLDSYHQVLHGRDTFQGPREHGVIWL